MSTPPVCEVKPTLQRLSTVRSVPVSPVPMTKSLSLRSQASKGSIELLSKEASLVLEGGVSSASEVLKVTVLPQESGHDDAMDTGDAAVVVPVNAGGEDSEVQDADSTDEDVEEIMDAEDAGTSSNDEASPSKSDHAVPSGSSDVAGPSAVQAPYMGPAPIEIIISFDTTGSMSYYLDEVKAKVQDIIQRLFMDIPNMKIGVMAHGDYCDEKVFYLMQKVDFTNDVDSLCQFVKDVEGTGGGDFEECYEWVLSQVRQLDWTPGTQRSLIMIGDAVPHESDYELNKDNLDWKAEADALYNEQGVRIYAVQCQNEKGAADFWKQLAQRTHGHHLKLDQFSSIVDILMAICYKEHSAEYFEAYEKEVRSRVGPHIVPELDSAFDVLRGGPGTSKAKKFDISAVDLSKGASKKKATVRPVQAKRNATEVVKKAAKNAAEPSTSAAAARRNRQPAKNLDAATRKAAKAITKARQVKQSKEPKNKIGAKVQRETVPGTKFLLNGLQWSEWKLAMCKDAPDERDIWQKRTRGRPGFWNVSLFSRSSDKTAIYEFAVKQKDSRKKYVVYSKATAGFTGRLWDSALLRKDRVQAELVSVIAAGCELYVRRAVIKGSHRVNGKVLKTPREFSTVLRSQYDYAWRCVRRAGSAHVSHRQLDIGSGILVSQADKFTCICAKCS